MEAFTTHRGLVAPLNKADVDTDQIIPIRYLRKVERAGLEDGLLHELRFLPDGRANPDFVLNKPQYSGATILVARRTLGNGSSREQAPWALQQYGFRVVIAPALGDIFHNNCYANGILAIVLSDALVDQIIGRAEKEEGYSLMIDLEQQTVDDGHGLVEKFEIDPFVKHKLLKGLDHIALTLQHEDAIAAYEARRPSFMPHWNP